MSGRTDVILRLADPVNIDRPLGEPVPVTELAIAVDDPARFVADVEAARGGPVPRGHGQPMPLAWVTPAELAEALA